MNKTKCKVHMIRHGITTANLKMYYYGTTDVPLAEEGIAELTRLKAKGTYPEPETPFYFTSGMLRTEQTFSLLYGDRPHKVIPAYQEMHFGEFEMRTHEEMIQNPAYQAWMNKGDVNVKPPGGESVNEFLTRIKKGESELLAKLTANGAKEAVVICHGGVITTLAADGLEGSQVDFHKWLPEPCHGFTFYYEEGKLQKAEPI